MTALTKILINWSQKINRYIYLSRKSPVTDKREIFKLGNMVSTALTEDIYHFFNTPYDLQNNSILLRKRGRTVF